MYESRVSLTGFVSTCDKLMELFFDVAWTLDSSESSQHIVTPMCVFGSQNAMTDGTRLKKNVRRPTVEKHVRSLGREISFMIEIAKKDHFRLHHFTTYHHG